MNRPAPDQAARHAFLTDPVKPNGSIRSLAQQEASPPRSAPVPCFLSRPVIRRSPVLIAAALAMVLALAMRAQEAPVEFTTEEPAGMTEAATKLRPALFFTKTEAGKKVFGHVGFFIHEDGLALFPLDSLCAGTVPIFRTAEAPQAVLKPPVVLEVFPDQALALVKFDHRPQGNSKHRHVGGCGAIGLHRGRTTAGGGRRADRRPPHRLRIDDASSATGSQAVQHRDGKQSVLRADADVWSTDRQRAR
jgi:hypothetical protein